MFQQFLNFAFYRHHYSFPQLSHLTSKRRTANIFEFSRIIFFSNDPLAAFNDTSNWPEDHGIYAISCNVHKVTLIIQFKRKLLE